jgi:hypothetical protein
MFLLITYTFKTKMKILTILIALTAGSLSMTAQSEFTGAIEQPTMESLALLIDCSDADVNGDGRITVMDILVWTSQFGQSGNLAADVDGNGFVGVMDKLYIASLYGQTCD